MTEIKICGITNIEDAIFATENGADALGFIFHPASPRCITPQLARQIIRILSRKVARVGVFVNSDVREVMWTADYCGLDFIQLHGDETQDYCRHFPASRLIKVVFPMEEADVDNLRLYPVKAILADSRDTGRQGGTGKATNWSAAKKISEMMPLVLAGGLHIGNIEEAIKTVLPSAVDVCSGVEARPGKKDPEKVKNIIEIVRLLKINEGMKIFGET
jgi:phosphoribosylanthranilate isomerase